MLVGGAYLSEAGGQVPQLLQHGPLDAGLADVAVVLAGALRSAGRAPRTLVARLVEVGLRHQDQRLDRDQHLEGEELIRTNARKARRMQSLLDKVKIRRRQGLLWRAADDR